MVPFKNTLFHSSCDQDNKFLKPQAALFLLLVLASVLFLLGYISINYDPAFEVATISRALYVDEGFYSDAAQNFIKFGDWGLPYDSRHWPGAPALTLIQTIVFSLFGMSLTVARMICVFFGLLSMFCIYAIVRTRLSTLISVALAIVCVLAFNFTAHSRVAIADPIATCFSLLAIAVYVRVRNRYWAIPVSLVFAYLALCSKMYFLFALVTICIVWVVEIVFLPLFKEQRIKKSELALFAVSLVLIGLSYAALRYRFDDSFSQFFLINSNKTPSLNPIHLIRQFIFSVQHLPFNTKTHFSLICISLLLVYYIFKCFGYRTISQISQSMIAWGRTGWVLSIFLLLGLCTTAGLNLPDKAHYYYFSILPIICLSVLAINAVVAEKIKTTAIFAMLAVQLLSQGQYYYKWLDRPERALIHNANVNMLKLIEQNTESNPLPVIGQYSAQLALYSDRMVSLEVKWLPKAGLCQRLEYWRPEFFVNFLFPERIISEGDRLARCESLSGFKELARYNVNEHWNDELILYRLVYAD